METVASTASSPYASPLHAEPARACQPRRGADHVPWSSLERRRTVPSRGKEQCNEHESKDLGNRRRRRSGPVFPGLCAIVLPFGGHGVPAATGLGESAPRAANLATDSAWRIYEFRRDGVTYLQINDATGVVRAAVGRINDTLWVLPMGKDVARVSLSSTPAAPGRVVYQTGDFVVWLRPDAKGDAWVVTSRD